MVLDSFGENRLKFRDTVCGEGCAELCGGLKAEVFISWSRGGDDLAFGFLSGTYASGGYVKKPDFFEPA